MLTTKEASLLAALEPRAIEEGIEIVTIEVVGSRKAPTIRVYIDTEQGIVFDDIAAAQAWINEILDEIDPFPGAYTLEVSSPGIDRPLRTRGHFEAAVGEQVYATCSEPVDGRSRFTGTLLGDALDKALCKTQRIAGFAFGTTVNQQNVHAAPPTPSCTSRSML